MCSEIFVPPRPCCGSRLARCHWRPPRRTLRRSKPTAARSQKAGPAGTVSKATSEPTTTVGRFDGVEPASTDSKATANSTAKSKAPASKPKAGGRYRVNDNGQVKSDVKIESDVRTSGDCCPVPQNGTGRYKGKYKGNDDGHVNDQVKGNGQFNGNVKGARLKTKSRRPLQRQRQRQLQRQKQLNLEGNVSGKGNVSGNVNRGLLRRSRDVASRLERTGRRGNRTSLVCQRPTLLLTGRHGRNLRGCGLCGGW